MAGFPRRYVVFDTESDTRRSKEPGWDNEQRLRLGAMKIYDHLVIPSGQPCVDTFTTGREFRALFDCMPHDKEVIWLFAHRLDFDLRMVEWFRWVAEGHYTLLPPPESPGAGRYKEPLFAADGYPTMFRFWRRDGQQIMCVDSYNWFMHKLVDIGDMIGYEKGQMPDPSEGDDVWTNYCIRDVEVLDKALRRLWGWLQCLQLPDFHLTPAGQAAAIFRMRFCKGRIKRPADVDLLKLDRHAYYAGKVECFRVGRLDSVTYQVDINGLYPYVMSENLYPCEVDDHGDHGGQGGWPQHVDPARATAEVWIETHANVFPCRGSDGTLYVGGRVRTVLCGPELACAVRDGLVRRTGRWVMYRVEDLFSKYVRCFWDLRRRAVARGDQLINGCCKLLLNSLHGKFGQRDGEWQYCGRTESRRFFGGGRLIGDHVDRDIAVRVIAGHMFTKARDEEHPQAFVPIAAWTASYGRIYMDEMIAVAGAGEVLYQCCDSLVVTEAGYARLREAGVVDTTELGHFKTSEVFQWIDIQGVNQYDHDHGWKHAGIKSGSGVDVAGIYTVEEWESFSASVVAGSVASVSTRTTLKRPSRSYCRRYVHADGHTTPWRIDNWDVPCEVQSGVPVRPGGPGRQ